MAQLYYKDKNQKDAYTSPWSKREAIKIRLWELIWNLLIRWTPKIAYPWHLFWLKIFGCKIQGKPFIAPTCRIYAPWLLEIGHKACLASRSEVYNLGRIKINAKATIAQYVYLCNATHDMSNPKSKLLVGYMEIGENSFIGAKAIIMPGIKINEGAIVGAGSVLTKDAEAWSIYAGNPAKFIKKRIVNDE